MTYRFSCIESRVCSQTTSGDEHFNARNACKLSSISVHCQFVNAHSDIITSKRLNVTVGAKIISDVNIKARRDLARYVT